jgi:hypothetical protein
MAKHTKTGLRTAAVVLEMKEAEGRSEREIAEATGLSASTVHWIVSRAHGWGEVAEREVFNVIGRNRTKPWNKLTGPWQPRRLKKADGKMDQASFYQLVYGAAIMTDKARLLAGESTQNIEVHDKVQVEGLDKLCDMLSQSLLPPAIDVTPRTAKD